METKNRPGATALKNSSLVDIGPKWAQGQSGVYQKFCCILLKHHPYMLFSTTKTQEQPPMGLHHEK